MGRVIGPGSHADLQVAPDPGEGLLDSLGRERDLRVRGAMGVRGVSGVSGMCCKGRDERQHGIAG